MSSRLIVAALCVFASGCASVNQRFSQEVQTSFARDHMRRLETRSLVVYYPEEQKDAILPTLARLQQCAETLRGFAKSKTDRGKLVILVTSAEFNNAFVRARIAGTPTEMLLPVQMGSEVFNFFDFGVTNVGDIACHESVHYVQLEQTDGFWKYMNLIFGDVASPNLGTETWFLEGLATYFEGDLGESAGRPHSPLWNGMFESGIAWQGGDVQAGELSPDHRELYPFGGNYETGSHFVSWLGRTYGNDKLWQLIDEQGHSIFFPFGTTLRFKAVYGKTIGALLDEYSAEMRQTLKDRPRPANQTIVVGDLGYYARIGSGPSGELAIASVGLDQIPLLEVREPDGRVRFSEPLARILPERPWIVAHPTAMGAPSFTADGRFLFFFAEDIDVDTNTTYSVREFDAHTGAFVKQWTGLRGVGGSVTPDGSGFIFVRIENGLSELARLDTATGEVTALTSLNTHDPLGSPFISPDGARIAFPRFQNDGFDLWLREADGTVRALTRDRDFNYSPTWIDAHTLLFLHDDEGRAQAWTLNVDTGAEAAVTQAPFAVMDPVRTANGRVAFVNRDGWKWTLDAVPLADARPRPASATAQPPPSPSAATTPTNASAALAPIQITADEPYTGLDELFLPRLRVPFVAATFDPNNQLEPYLALSVMGFDRLGWHNWALNLTYDGFDRQPSIGASYGNAQLAPWFLEANVQRAVNRSAVYADDQPTTPENIVGKRTITDISGRLSASRAFWATDVSFAAQALDRVTQAVLQDGSTPERHVRLIGPSTAVSWFAGESTPYAGTRRGMSLDFSLGAYPEVMGSSFNVVDVRGALGVWIPLPDPKRQTFAISLRGRGVFGPADGLLQLGGVSSGYGYWLRDANVPSDQAPNILLPGISFVEPLRGFDDVAFRVNRAAILDMRYRYPIPFDRGTTSTFWLGPSFFLRQVEAEGFFSGAATDITTHPLHGAVGALVRVRTVFGSVFPVSAYYQFAYRIDPGLGVQHVIGLTFD